jgi:Caspase domain
MRCFLAHGTERRLGEVGDIIPARGPTWIDADSFLDLRIDAALAGFVAASADGRPVAMVIGNSAYANVPALPNPANDAGEVAAALKRFGFCDDPHHQRQL